MPATKSEAARTDSNSSEAKGTDKPKRLKGKKFSSEERAHLCVDLAVHYKALDVVLLEVTQYSSFADYFIICSGTSSRQVQGLADNLEKDLRDHGIKPLGVEGRQEGQWVLMDYNDVIIHIFYEPVRSFYDLESLWSEARKVRSEARHKPVDADFDEDDQ